MAQRVRIARCAVAVVLLAVVAAAGGPQPVDNPYQGEFPFTLGEPLDPGVSIDGVVWNELKVTPLGKLRSGKAVKTLVEMGFDNGRADGVRILVVVLFEDETGQALDRVELDPVSVGAGRAKRFRQKLKIQSDVLSASAKVYLFCEVQER